MKKILLLNNRYPTNDNPHQASYIVEIGKALSAAGFEVERLVLNQERKGLFKYLYFFIQILKKDIKKYSVIYVNHPTYCFPIFFKDLKEKKIYLHWHGDDLMPNNKFKERIFSWIFKIIKKHQINHIAPSYYFSHEVQKRFPKDHIFISPSGGIDTEKFKSLPVIKNSFVIDIGFASALTKSKGADDLIWIVKKLLNTDRDMKIHVIDYGTDRLNYKRILHSFKDVVIHGKYSHDTIQNFYQKMDIVLLFTKKESLGLVGLEAMSCGVPIVGPDAFAIPEYIIPGVSGELFEIKNRQSMVEAIEKCIKNLKSYAPRDVITSNYSKENVIEFYRKVLND